jgi:LCP family protein required for cell wall assembly
MSSRRHEPSRRSSRPPKNTSSRRVANEQRLLALGAAIDRRESGGRAGAPRGKAKVAQSRQRRRRQIVGRSAAALAVILVLVIAGGYWYSQHLFNSIKKTSCAACAIQISGEPFNVLEIGSDSRLGLTGQFAAATGGGQVTGQRSDVVKIMHVDPTAKTIQVVSIPRDTLVSMVGELSVFGKYNRINVNYNNGPDLLVKTIEANFGIPIQHVVQVSFAGLANVADAVNGVYLYFPYPAHDAYSGLQISHSGCQLVKGFEALAVARSRHYYYNVEGKSYFPSNYAALTFAQLRAYGWVYDGSSDYGRIHRQDSFIRALINRAKGMYNPFTVESVLSKIPMGVTLDQGFSFNDLVGLAVKFHSFDAANLVTYTLPVASAGNVPGYGDVLTVAEPATQRLLVSIFGHEVKAPSNPPPNAQLQPTVIPYVPVTTPTTTTTVKGTILPVTTTTVPYYYTYNPTPCTPK